MQVKPQAVPSQVACEAPVGTGQGVHDAPQAFTLLVEGHSVAQAWVPLGHAPSQD
jgi:hypothetical protein